MFRSISSGQDLSGVSAAASFFETGAGGDGSASDTQTFGDCVVTTTQLGDIEVHDVGLCTICDERFFSHRRDQGVTGRQAGVICRA